MTNKTIDVQGAEISVSMRKMQDYISLTDIVKRFDGGSALIDEWLKNKDTLLFMGVWEQTRHLIPSNSMELKTRRAATAISCQRRNGSKPLPPLACKPKQSVSLASTNRKELR